MTGPLRDICRGRWPNLLTMFGLDRRYLSGRHGPCPMCGGKDRFRFDDKEGRGSWICTQCGAGDGFALLMRLNGWDFKRVADEVEAVVGKVEPVSARRTLDEKALRDAMNRLWASGKPVQAGDPVAEYLAGRGIMLADFPLCLRYVERCRYQDDTPSWHPAMIAKVTGADGRPVTLHRTYLDGMGGKAKVAAPRRLMPGRVDKGCAVRLAEPGSVLGIAEGIETALSASLIFTVPVWAALNAGMLMAWEPPAGVEEVLIFGDNDPTYAGQSAAFALAHRLSVKDIRVDVAVPARPGDWNDELMARGRARGEMAAAE